jgi:hypothetical protein
MLGRDGQLFQNRDAWMSDHHGYFRRESRVNLPFFRQNRPAFGDFQRSKMMADADNALKNKRKQNRDDSQ